jgi:hypothetical protein
MQSHEKDCAGHQYHYRCADVPAAMNAGADAIVTFNVRDFVRANQHDVDIMQPKLFLEQIGVL